MKFYTYKMTIKRLSQNLKQLKKSGSTVRKAYTKKLLFKFFVSGLWVKEVHFTVLKFGNSCIYYPNSSALFNIASANGLEFIGTRSHKFYYTCKFKVPSGG